MDWFTAHGSKVLAFLLTVLTGLHGMNPAALNGLFGTWGQEWVAFLLSVATLAHATFVAPNGVAPKNNQQGRASAGLLAGLAALAALALLACATLGLQSPQSFDERLSYAYGTHTAILQATAAATGHGLTPAETRQILALADESRALLDAAHAIETTDPKGADQRLSLATSVLSELQTYLRSHPVH